MAWRLPAGRLNVLRIIGRCTAKVLSFGDKMKTSKTPRLVPEMIQARALMGFSALVEAHGGKPRAMLTRCRIPVAALENPDLPISLDSLARLYDHAARKLNLTDFGLRLSTHQDLSLYGPLALIVLHSHTVGEALEGLTRYFSFHTPGGKIRIDAWADPAIVCVRYVLDLDPSIASRQIVEQSYGMASKLWARVALTELANARILLRHPPALDPAVYRSYFGCACHFHQDIDAILLPRHAMDFVVEHSNPELLAGAEAFITNILRRYPLDVAKQVEVLVSEQLAFGGATIENVSCQLKIHKRQLQRRLADQGLYFENIVDDLRCFRAGEYLRNDALTHSEVGAMLGYTEQSSFIRACRRWFGASPKRVHEVLQKP